ncbi:MAG: crossover junction endodeoxyribonuclease RuvC [Bacteriovoracaceae bacterium]
MIILGIDPGSRKTGFAILELQQRKVRYIDSGILRFDKIDDFIDRVDEIYSQCEELVTKYSPDEIAIESLIFAKNPSSLIKLAQARGAMLAAFLKTHKNRLYEYSPNVVKSSATGYGHAKKENVKKFIDIFLGAREYKSFDETDAIAVAICHTMNRTSLTNKRLHSDRISQRKDLQL